MSTDTCNIRLGTVNHSVISAVYTLPPPGGVNIHWYLMDGIRPAGEQVQWVLLEWFIFYEPIPAMAPNGLNACTSYGRTIELIFT